MKEKQRMTNKFEGQYVHIGHKKYKIFPCKECGAPVYYAKLKYDGSGYFEGRQSLVREKHPCFTIGDGLSKKRDTDTLDMFGRQK